MLESGLCRLTVETSFDLAPSTIAKPLPAYKYTTRSVKKQVDGLKRKRAVENSYKHDDTPRAFSRMMQLQSSKKRQRSGLDDGMASHASEKKRKVAQTTDAPTQDVHPQDYAGNHDRPQILPGERLADFAARVNQALPVDGLARKGKVKVEGLKERQTKTEKRLQKIYAAWREEDARRKEKVEEQKELEEEREAEVGGVGLQVSAPTKKSKRRKTAGAEDEDPWAELKAKRDQPKGLHDVVQAPPNFKVLPKEKFKVRNGAKVDVANIPSAAGSLKRREELGDARREVIDRYRAMMGNRDGGR